MFVDFSLAFTGILNRMMMFKLIMVNCDPASLPAGRQAKLLLGSFVRVFL